MGDLLSASSMLLAVVAVLFGMWQEQISLTLSQVIPRHFADRKAIQKKLRNVLFSKSIPLSVAAWLMFILFFPETWSSACLILQSLQDKAIDYDSVRAAFIVTQFFVGLIAVYASKETIFLVLRLVESHR